MSIEQSNIVIKLGETVEIKSPDRLRIQQQVNEHATIYFREQINGNIAKYRRLVEGQTGICVYPVNSPSHRLSSDAPRILFQGIATKIEVRYDPDGADYIEVFGMSYTYLMDITRKRRSFQNKKQSLREMVNEILTGYPNALCIIDHTIGKNLLKRFLLQWNETDWDYLKRVASVLLNTVLVANSVAEKPVLSIGIPEGRERHLDSHCRLNYEISSVMEDSEFGLQLNRSRFDDKLDENDRFYFTFTDTNEIYQIGDRINFHQRVLTVCKITAELKGNILKFSYIMATPNGLKVPRIYNEAIVGQAISGKVMDVNDSSVKIDLEIDQGRKFDKEQASWFPYATPYTGGGRSGWYFMPEIGDKVQLTFPSNREEQAYVIYAVRNKQTHSTDDPQIKYLRIKDGKELRFGPKELVITGKDKSVYIQMTEDEGITINSNTNITLEAKGKILLAANEN
ncbi:MAG TPA: phage baseplate assembly protein V, partial [Bacillota bacterium]